MTQVGYVTRPKSEAMRVNDRALATKYWHSAHCCRDSGQQGRTVSLHGAGSLKADLSEDRIIKSEDSSVLKYLEYSNDRPGHHPCISVAPPDYRSGSASHGGSVTRPIVTGTLGRVMSLDCKVKSGQSTTSTVACLFDLRFDSEPVKLSLAGY